MANMTRTFTYWLLIFLLFIIVTTTQVIAVSHNAHVHGHAELTIAVDQHTIALHLIAPAESLLGFEHQARNVKEVAQVMAVKQHLEKFSNAFYFDTAHCQMMSANVNTGHLLKNTHDKHPHQHDKHVTHQPEHAEITANYTYRCQQTDEIKIVSVELFQHYQGLKQIRAMWVTPIEQASAMLTPTKKTVKFK